MNLDLDSDTLESITIERLSRVIRVRPANVFVIRRASGVVTATFHRTKGPALWRHAFVPSRRRRGTA